MNKTTHNPAFVSVHGGHSGEFCSHARDSLEDIVRAYLDRGFAWVGITEHMPPASDAQLPPEERAAGLDAESAYERFAAYFACARALQRKYASSLEIHVGFEAESHTGSEDLVRRILREFRPDYVVGSVHHVQGVCIDATRSAARVTHTHGNQRHHVVRRSAEQERAVLRHHGVPAPTRRAVGQGVYPAHVEAADITVSLHPATDHARRRTDEAHALSRRMDVAATAPMPIGSA